MLKIQIVDYNDYYEQIRNIRDDVFVREQKVSQSIEVDGLDPEATHSIVFDENKEIGTGRILKDGHIGRIAVKKQYRGKGVGKIIMESLLDIAKANQIPEVWLSSQYHAKGFYEKLGFIETGDVYQEAGIDHIKMKKKLYKYSLQAI